MTNNNKRSHEEMNSEYGGGAVAILVILVIAAVGVLAYISGKKDLLNTDALEVPSVIAKADVENAPDPENNPVVVKIGKEEITRQDVIDLVNQMPPQMQQIPMPQLLPMAVEQLVSNKIVDEKAKNAGLGRDKDVLAQLAEVKKQIIRSKFLENEIEARITEERLKAAYDKYVENFPKVEEVKAAHILVDEEKTAKDIIKKLKKGDSFADLAKENSKDGSAEGGGDLGYFAKTDVVPEFAEAAFALKAGAYTQKPVKTDFGYHIIKVEEKRQRPPAAYEEATQYLEQEMQREVLDEALNEWKSAVTIERFDMNGKPLAEKEPAAGEAEDETAEDTKAEDMPKK